MTSTVRMTAVSGSSIEKPATAKAGSRMSSISSLPYADDEMQSDDRTPSARNFERRSCLSWSLVSGLPSSVESKNCHCPICSVVLSR